MWKNIDNKMMVILVGITNMEDFENNLLEIGCLGLPFTWHRKQQDLTTSLKDWMRFWLQHMFIITKRPRVETCLL